MATVVLKVPVGDGGEIVEVEVDRSDLGSQDRERLLGNRPDPATAAFSLSSSIDRIMPALSAMLRRFRSVEYAPDEIGIELGLKVGGETGLIIAKGTADASFTVTLAWRRPAVGGPPGDAGRLDGARTSDAD
jgi:Trypsin-co-occurring domain 1